MCLHLILRTPLYPSGKKEKYFLSIHYQVLLYCQRGVRLEKQPKKWWRKT